MSQTSDVGRLPSSRASGLETLPGGVTRRPDRAVPIASAKADAAYDTGDVYKTLENHRAHRSPKVLIPPRKGAQLALDSAGTRQRNRNIRARSRVGKTEVVRRIGLQQAKQGGDGVPPLQGHPGLSDASEGTGVPESRGEVGCKILNTMTALGIPDGEMIG